MSMIEAAIQYARDRRDAHLEEWKELLTIPSISTLPENKDDMVRVAEWIANRLRGLGMDNVGIVPTPLHPVVYGESLKAPGKPTVLVYGHYDVQPADPLDLWDSPPFEPAERDDCLYARGAADMKGQLVSHLQAVEALLAQGDLPFNVRYMFEGEEEIGSPNLPAFIDANKDRLQCDFLLNIDTGILGIDKPAIVCGLRGLAYFEIEVQGPSQDLHSGMFGGVVQNPVNVLCKLIGGMHDDDLRVTLPGFYDKVRDLDDEARETVAATPGKMEEDYLRMSGAPALAGEKGYVPAERLGARPTLDVNGIVGGFTGDGSKTVLPAKAMAKISMRLVPDQQPEDVPEQLREYMRQNVPDTVTWEVRELAHGPGAVVSHKSEWMQKGAAALTEVFGTECVFYREGGSVPVVGILQQKLGVDAVMMGFGLPDDNTHSPNERQHIPTYFRGLESYIRFLGAL